MVVEDLSSVRTWALKFQKRIILLGVVFAVAVGNDYVKTVASFANGLRRSLFDRILYGTFDPSKILFIKAVGYTLSFAMQVGMLPILILIVFLLFRWQSVRLIKKNRLVQLPVEKIPTLRGFVSSIWEMHRLPPNRMPRLYWQPFKKDVNAFVFGGLGNRAIALTAGLLLDCVRGDRRKAKAILNHELGHMHNQDVTYFYLMQVFMLLFMLSFVLVDIPLALRAFVFPDSLIYSGAWTTFPVRYHYDSFGVRLETLFEILEKLVIFAILTLAMRYTIRERENYADAWAVDHGTPVADLEDVLAERSSVPLSLRHSPILDLPGLRRIMRYALRFHPESHTRARTLGQPLTLINPSLAYSFATGFLGALQINQLGRFGLPQVVGLIGILCALWSLCIDSQAIAIVYRVSPGPGTPMKAIVRLLTHATMFSLAFVLGFMAEGTTEIYFAMRYGSGIDTLTFFALLTAYVGGLVVLCSVIFSCTSLVTFAAATVVLRTSSKTQVSGSFAFNWGIPICGATCYIVFAIVLLAMYPRSANLTTATQVSPTSTPTLVQPTVTFRPLLPTVLSEHQLTFGNAPDLHPRWSPNGLSIAFHSARAGNYDIWVVAAEGGVPKQLTTSPLDEGFAAWSPDGMRIAFLRFTETVEEGRGDLYVMNADGSNQVQLTSDGTTKSYVSWTPGDRKLVYSESIGTPDNFETSVWIFDIETKEQKKLMDYMVGSFSYRPEGTHLVFDAVNPQLFRRRWLYVMDIQQQVVTPLVTDVDRPWFPHWSPDSGWIAFHAGLGGSDGIWVVRSDGTDKTELVTSPEGDRFPCWSPDSKRIAFTRGRRQGAHIWIADLKTEKP